MTAATLRRLLAPLLAPPLLAALAGGAGGSQPGQSHLTYEASGGGSQPEQFHLSYEASGGVWVTWVVPALAAADAERPPATAAFCEVAAAGSPPTRVAASTKTYTDNNATAAAGAPGGCRSDHAYGGPCVPWAG